MGRKRGHSARRALMGATAWAALLWSNSISRATPTILLRFEHTGHEAGIAVNDCLQLRVAGFTWSDGTVDLLRGPACRTLPSGPYAAGGCDSLVTFERPAARYALHFSGTAEDGITDRAEILDMAIPQMAEQGLRTSSGSLPVTVMRLIETTFEPALWNPEIRP